MNAAKLEALPGKALLIKLSYRPPNYEKLIDYLPSRDSQQAVNRPTIPAPMTTIFMILPGSLAGPSGGTVVRLGNAEDNR
jgi:hypothetical protein